MYEVQSCSDEIPFQSRPSFCGLLVFVPVPIGVGDPCVPDCRTGTQGFAKMQHCCHTFGSDSLFSSSVTPVLSAV